MKYSIEKEQELLALENENVLPFRDRLQWGRYSKSFTERLTQEYWEQYELAEAEAIAG